MPKAASRVEGQETRVRFVYAVASSAASCFKSRLELMRISSYGRLSWPTGLRFRISDLRFLILNFEIPSSTESRNRGLEISNPKSKNRRSPHPWFGFGPY